MLLFCFEKPILTQTVVTNYLNTGHSSGLYFLFISCWFSASLCPLPSLHRNDQKPHPEFWQKQVPVVPSWGGNSGGSVLCKWVVLWRYTFYTILRISSFANLTLFKKPTEYLIQFSVLQLCCAFPPSSPPAWKNVCGTARNCGHLGTAFSSASCKRGWCGGWKVFIEMLLFTRLLTAACDSVEAECD